MFFFAVVVDAPVWASNAGRLRLDLTLNKKTYVFGEPVSMEVSLTNLGMFPVRTRTISFSTGLWLLYRHESENEFRYYADPLTRDIAVAEDRVIPPQGHLFSAFIVLDANRWQNRGNDASDSTRTLFLAPGRYYFKVRYRIGSEFVESEIITVECIAPKGLEFEAWKLWQDVQVLATIHGSGMPEDVEQGTSKLKELIERFPTSIYAAYARSRLSGVVDGLDSMRSTEIVTSSDKKAQVMGANTLPKVSQSEAKTEHDNLLARYWMWSLALAGIICFALIVRKFNKF